MTRRNQRRLIAATVTFLVVGAVVHWLTKAETNSPVCPHCKTDKQTIPIVYGLPDPELWEAARAGECQVGGCIVSKDSHQWHCKSCGKEWGRTAQIARKGNWWAFWQ